MRTLLACFDLTGVVVTVDAMHTQTDTATAIVDAHGDYVFTLKANQPTPVRGVSDCPGATSASTPPSVPGTGPPAARTVSGEASDRAYTRTMRPGPPAPAVVVAAAPDTSNVKPGASTVSATTVRFGAQPGSLGSCARCLALVADPGKGLFSG